MIPAEAVEAALSAWDSEIAEQSGPDAMRAALEAAAPHMLADHATECSTCHGFGRIGDGPFAVGAECHDCGGRGVTPLTVMLLHERIARAIRDDDWPDCDDQIHHPIKNYMSNARAALEAAAPHMQPRIITSAEELDALPVGSVVAMIGSEPDSPSVACRAVRGWQFLGDDPERRYLSSSLMPSPEPITVLHDPETDRG